MKLADTKLKKVMLAIIVTVITLVTLCLIFVSPIAKYLIEKYDVEYTGRQIKINWAYVNPFTGYIYIDGLRISEAYKDTIFFSAKDVSANFEMGKLFSNTVEITQLDINEPLGIIIQKKDSLNFNDIIKRFTPKKPDEHDKEKKTSVRVSIDRITIKNGIFHYMERIIPIKYFIEKVNIDCKGIRWNSDTIASTFSFMSRGGHTKGKFIINTRTLDYNFDTVIRNQSLEIIRQYLWELINYGMFSVHMDANVKAYGNFHDPRRITMKGRLAFNNFHLGKTNTDHYASFKKLVLVMDELSPANNKYLFDSVTLNNSFFSYEHFDSLDNIQAMFGKKGSNITDVTNQSGRFNLVIELSRYIQKLARDFFVSQYRVNALALNDGEVKFSDYALNEKFAIAAQHVYLKADSISKTNKRVKFNLRCGLYPYGNSTAGLSINPRDSGDLDLVYHFHHVPVTVFNPYLITYTSFPLDKGVLELNGAWKVRQGKIKSENNLIVIQPRVADKQKSKDIKKNLPLPLIMSFVRERGDIINYKIPITGDLKDPHFHLHDVLMDFIKNIFIKPPTFPYAIEVRSIENDIETAHEITWPVHQASLDKHQQKFLRKLAHFLDDDKKASIEVYAQEYTQKEKEHILFFETKKKYFLHTNRKDEKDFSQEDSIYVEQMSVKSLAHVLVKNLRKSIRDTTMFTIQDKCNYYLGANRVNHKYNQLMKTRESTFRSFFTHDGMAARVKIHSAKKNIPYDGFSCFRIKYKGDIPKSLARAYDDMHELNTGIFRKKYFK